MFYVDVYFLDQDAEEQRKTTGPFTTSRSAEEFVRALALQFGFKPYRTTDSGIIKFELSPEQVIANLKEAIGEDGILSVMYSSNAPGSPSSKILYRAWNELVSLKKEEV